jgi:hypothetical protein
MLNLICSKSGISTGITSSTDSCELSNNKVLAAFQRLDRRADGSISRELLKKEMQTLDSAFWTDRRISRLFNALDRNRDGHLQYREFVEWACLEDTDPSLIAFRQAMEITREDAKSAARDLHPGRIITRRRSKPASARAVRPSGDMGTAKKLVRRKTLGDTAGDAKSDASSPPVDTASVPPEMLAAERQTSVDKSTEVPEETSSERLIIFDYDGTITIDKDENHKGLRGHRLDRLKAMMAKIQASSARCILVTAQFPHATQELTIPALEDTGLSGLFGRASLGSRACLYWDDAAQGTIYNGAKVMMGKIELIKKIIEGDNCWTMSFAPSNVLFIDDDIRNFRGHERLGIQIRHVAQDGMLEADMEAVEAFAQG